MLTLRGKPRLVAPSRGGYVSVYISCRNYSDDTAVPVPPVDQCLSASAVVDPPPVMS